MPFETIISAKLPQVLPTCRSGVYRINRSGGALGGKMKVTLRVVDETNAVVRDERAVWTTIVQSSATEREF